MRNILAASCLFLGAFASQAYSSELTSSKTTISDADNFTATARFTTSEQGDLYVAAQLPNGKFYFITESIGFSETPVVFKKNQSFSGDYTLLNLPAKGLTAGTYLLYSLVVNANASPYDSTSWVGGSQGLHILTFTMQAATSSTDAGKTLYNQFCVSCHGAAYRPASSASATRRAITSNQGGMGTLSSMTDAELTQIATYIQSVIGIVPPKP